MIVHPSFLIKRRKEMPRTKYAQRIQEDLEEEVTVNEDKKETTKAKKKFDPEDGILCRSVTVGGLCLTGIKQRAMHRFCIQNLKLIFLVYINLCSLSRNSS